MERWKTIKRHPQFEVSNKGAVRHKKFKRLRKFRNARGYYQVALRTNGILESFQVHRLVAENFLPDWDCGKDVDHVNRIRNDNRVENLRMMTRKENCKNRSYYLNIIEQTIKLHKKGLTPKEISSLLAVKL